VSRFSRSSILAGEPGERLTWEPTGKRGRDGVARIALLMPDDTGDFVGSAVLFEGDEGSDQKLGFVYGSGRDIRSWCASLSIEIR
jgi:hypothetical protein